MATEQHQHDNLESGNAHFNSVSLDRCVVPRIGEIDERNNTTALNKLHAEDKGLQNKAFLYLLEETAKPVDWAYDVWDERVAILKHKDNRQRAIAAQVLCNLAKSDPNKRIKDFSALLAATKDERFVTARHCMQALWKVGLAGRDQRKKLTVLQIASASAPRKRTAP